MYRPHRLSTAHLHHDTIGPNCTAVFFVWAVKWCTCHIACQQPLSIISQFFNLVPRWGICINILGGYDDKQWYFRGISDLNWMLWWFLIDSQEQWSLIYCKFLVGFKIISLQWFKYCQHTRNNTKHQFLNFTFFCTKGCGFIRERICPVRQSLIIHCLSNSFLFADGWFWTITLRGASTVSPFKGTENVW